MKKIIKHLPALLKRFVTYNVRYKAMALVFAFILWLVVVNIQNPAATRTFTGIPVEIMNEESVLDGDHIYTVKSGKTATITVAGTRTVLGNLSSSDFRATADFSALSLTNAAPIVVTLSGEKARYENQIDITVNTTGMVIDVEDVITQEYPVRVQYYGIKPESLVIDKVEKSTESITVSAPASIANNIAGVGVTVNYEDVVSNEPMEASVNLYDANGLAIARDDRVILSENTITLQFITFGEKTIPVRISTFGTPSFGYHLTGVTLSRDTVELEGDPRDLDQITAIDLPNTLLNIADKTASVTARIDLMEYLPEGIQITDAVRGKAYVVAVATIEGDDEIEESQPETQPATQPETTTASAN